ncbi:MAG TPA: hypothetical protein VJK26_03790 [Patescibacteria group bacterium]|nr:hypothetical protein [Patescibacteria group bacterium]
MSVEQGSTIPDNLEAVVTIIATLAICLLSIGAMMAFVAIFRAVPWF